MFQKEEVQKSLKITQKRCVDVTVKYLHHSTQFRSVFIESCSARQERLHPQSKLRTVGSGIPGSAPRLNPRYSTVGMKPQRMMN